MQYSTEQEEDGEDGKDRSYLYVFSAQHKDGVMKSIDTVREYLAARFDAEPDANPQGARWNGLMRNLSYTLYSRRSLLDYRGWVIASDPSQLAEALLDFDETKLVRASASKPMNATFVFAGQGAQWAGMGQGLMSVRPFAESISSAHLFLQQEFGFDLLRHLHAAAGPTNIDKPEVAQPASTAIQVALTDLLRTVGITPKAVVGHSSGEIAAAYAAGIISRETALAVAYHRGHSAAEIKHATPPLKGRMLATGLSETEAKKVLNAHEVRTMAGKVVIACVNSPRGVTLSGDEAKIGAIQAKLTEMNMFNRLLKVDTAYHSHHMKTVAAGYLDRLRHLASADRPAEPVCPMFSSVYGEEVEAAQITPEYWVENLVSTVQFVKAFQAMLEGLEARGIKPNVYVELSPRSHLGTPVKDILDHAGVPDRSHEYVETLSRTRRCDEAMLETFARLWTAGHRIHLDAFLELPRGKPAPLKCLVDLAPYHWDHSKIYWAESHLSRRHRFRQFGSQDLIGAPTADSVMPHEPRWRGHFRLHENPWMAHHKIQGEMLYPAAGMIAMAIEGGKQVVLDSFQDKPCGMIDYEVRKFHILAPMIVPDNEDGLEHCLNAKRVGERTQGASTTWTYEFTIYSKPGRDPPFVENATGILKVRFSKPGSKVSSPQPRANGTAQALLTGPSADQHHKSPMSPFEFYEGLDVIGMQYGPLFRNITHIGPIDAQLHSLNCATSMTVPHTKTIMPEHFEFDHVIHPATLDTMFQSVFSLGSEPMVPWFLESVRVDARLPVVAGTQLAMQTCAAREGLAQVSADVRAFVSTQPETNGTHGRSSTSVDPCHAKFVEIKGLKAKSLASTAADTLRFLPNHRHLCSEMQWHQDVEHAAFDDLHAWLKLLGFKWPGLSIAHLGNEANIPKTVMSALVAQEPGDKGNAATMSRLGSYLMRARSDRDFNSIKKSLPTKHAALLHKMDNSDGQEHDLVIYEDNVSISATELQALVKPSGFLLVVESTDTIAKNASFPALEAVCKPVAHPELGTLWLWHKPMALRVPVNESVHILHGAAHGGGSSETGAAYLAARLERSGLKVEFLTPEDVDKSPAGLGHNAGATVISLLELEEESSGRLFDMSEAEFDRMKKLMDMSKNLLWLSRGAQMNASSPRSAIFQGWSRTVRSEDAQKNIVTVDVAQPQTVGNRDLAERVAGIFLNSFFGTSDETEYCISAEDIYIPRLMPLTGVNAVIEHGIERAVFFEPGRFSDNKRGHLKLAIATPGDLTSLFYTVDDTATRPLGADEVRIRVHAAGLLPIDAETLRNNTTEMTVGADVYGQILEAGLDAMHMLATSATTGDLIGSHVVALARGTIRQVMIVPAPMVRPRYLPLETFAKHKQLSWSPAVYTTAWRLVSAVGHFLSNWTGPACVPVNMLLVGASSTYGQAFLQLYRVLKAPTQMKIDLMTTAPNDEAEAVERALERTNGEGFDLVIDPTFQGTPVGTECFRGGKWCRPPLAPCPLA